MDFFDNIRKKIRKRKSWVFILMLAFTAIYTSFAISYVSSQGEIHIGLLFILTVCTVGVVSGFFMYREDKAYKTIKSRAISYGGLDVVAQMIENLPQAPYTKGDLRLGEKVIFYFYSDYAFILNPLMLTGIKEGCYSNRGYKYFYVTIYHKQGKEQIATDSAESAAMLCEMLKAEYAKQLELNARKYPRY